ncbi:ATP-binding cassette domain-containing protein [Streptomyces varsoviensis]|uniref:ABC transporter ATP-binding protein n=1 Tax=Streptomyces varsoviensis TaxID=67373 RepID=UPI0033C83C12
MTFGVRKGELFGFVGSNGAGKTTTMRIVAGVAAADSGEVRWHAEPLNSSVRASIGYMPEERGLYPKMTVADHLVYLARLHGLPGKDAFAAMERWTERLDVARHRGHRVESLSLGNQQRVQLAGSLVHEPRLLLLDEPFSGLDPLAVETMSAVLREKAAQGVPVLFSSHQLELVERLCDRVGIVRGGTMVACGTVEELRAGTQDRLYIEVAGAPAKWWQSIDGIGTARPDGLGTVFELSSAGAERALVSAAAAAGTIRALHHQTDGLADIFRSVTGPPERGTAEGSAPPQKTGSPAGRRAERRLRRPAGRGRSDT